MTEPANKFNLTNYIPCQLATLSHAIMRALATVFEDRFDISLPEWKVLAIVAERPGLSAVSVARLAQMDTVAVSRAVTKLLDRGLIDRQLDTQDRRCSVLNLSAAGRDFHAQITPLAADVEASLFEDVSDDVRLVLEKTLRVLHSKTELLADKFSTPRPRLFAQANSVNGLTTREHYRPHHPAPLVDRRLNRTADSFR
ncbi:MAG: MarR family transcriptional regulator [Gammaproteobacteria bacterium]|nr:MarR family transcriptional regulator [Gammaproteobacteria bacterium]